MLGTQQGHRVEWHQLRAVAAALVASLAAAAAIAATASATNENYNCETVVHKTTCLEAQGRLNYITNDYGIDYTKSSICVGTAKWESGGYYTWWALECTSARELLVCDGGEYQIYGSGITYDRGDNYDNLAGTQNNYQSCKH